MKLSYYSVVIIIILLGGLFTSASISAREKYAKKEHVKCGYCHDNSSGGGPRNLNGLYYQATKKLPKGVNKEKINFVVDSWLDEVAHQPPEVIWRYVPLDDLQGTLVSAYEPALDLTVLRRMSLDLKGELPEPDEVLALKSGVVSLEDKLETYLSSKDFIRNFNLYHRDVLRLRTGIHGTEPAYTKLNKRIVDGLEVFTSSRINGEETTGACKKSSLVQVEPYWDRSKKINVCAKTAKTTLKVKANKKGKYKELRCDRISGQETGKCGCGPHLVFCYSDEVSMEVIHRDMKYESANVAMEIVKKEMPYSGVLTANWTMQNGRLEHYYARLTGHLNKLKDADWSKPWRKVNRPKRHSGIITSPAYLNFNFNGRRWAQKTFEAFMCHEVFPDYDLLDDQESEPLVSYLNHPQGDPNVNVTSGRACAACHLQLDGLSRVKDRWDWHGKYYKKTNGKSVPQAIRFMGKYVDGVDSFGWVLSKSEVFHRCVVNQVWDHMLGHRFKPAEYGTLKDLVSKFQKSELNFKQLLRDVVETKEYRAKRSVKLMNRELYWRAMEQITGVKWEVGGRRGFDVYYDKVGGSDYRKIEKRDKAPGQGYSLVQFKAAAETCNKAVDRSLRETGKEQNLLYMGGDLSQVPDDKTLHKFINAWYIRIFSKSVDDVEKEKIGIYKKLFSKVSNEYGVVQGYKALCTTMLASADFAIY